MMENPQDKISKRKKRITPRKFTRLIFIIFVAYLVFNFSYGFYQAYQLKCQVNKLEKELVELKKENSKLQKELEYINSPEAVEKLAREKLGLIKPGETIIMKARKAQ